MGQYKANSKKQRNYSLTETGKNNKLIGELVYPKWYSLKADINLADKTEYKLAKKGRWSYKIELQQNDKILSELKIGWKGIIIKAYLDGKEQNYQLKLRTLLRSKYILIDREKNELVTVDTDFQWKKLRFDYNITTTDEFDKLEYKELLLFVILYGLNYQKALYAAAA